MFDKSKNVYRLCLTNGKRKNLGKDKVRAIAIAREYNYRMRAEIRVSIEHIIRESGGVHGETKPFCEHADNLFERAIQDEQPAKDTLETWKNDILRVKDYFTIPSCDIDLEHVNGYLKKYHAGSSANVQNRKVSFLKKLFSYAVDESLMLDNPAERKKMKRTDPKKRARLTLEDYNKIRALAEPWMRTAMDLALQTTQARLEISRIRYQISKPEEGICGCI